MNINKVALLIDGGFFSARFKAIHNNYPTIAGMQPFIEAVLTKVQGFTGAYSKDILFRSFYYDCRPYGGKEKDPAGNWIDFAASGKHKAVSRFHNDLRTFQQMALRLGDLSFDGWKIDNHNPGNYIPDFKQKSVDMKIGLDIAWMASKRTVDKIVLVAGDSDFISPMKFARREGLLVYLYPMEQKQIKLELKEHADFILS